MRKISLFLVVLVLMVSGCTQTEIPITGTNELTCSADTDCVPAECCHPTSCVNKDYKANCDGIACTLNCEPNTLNCGQGECKCVDNKCKAVIGQLKDNTQLANPASVYCKEQGGTLAIKTDETGGQYGVCTLADGTECEEWAYYNGECGVKK